jgi:hypothetical protein
MYRMSAANIACLSANPSLILDATLMLDILERTLHRAKSEWIFFRELKVGTGHRHGSLQRLDAFALNCLRHQAMRRICYELKISRADFLSELNQPVKRRMGMRYSNEFYFVTPHGLVDYGEIPVGCGLIEIGQGRADAVSAGRNHAMGLGWSDPEARYSCTVAVPACWRDTEAPTWQFAAAMLRNQQRALEEKPPLGPKQRKLELI